MPVLSFSVSLVSSSHSFFFSSKTNEKHSLYAKLILISVADQYISPNRFMAHFEGPGEFLMPHPHQNICSGSDLGLLEGVKEMELDDRQERNTRGDLDSVCHLVMRVTICCVVLIMPTCVLIVVESV